MSHGYIKRITYKVFGGYKHLVVDKQVSLSTKKFCSNILDKMSNISKIEK